MELLAAASILGIGYMFSNSLKINRNEKIKFKTNVLKKQINYLKKVEIV